MKIPDNHNRLNLMSHVPELLDLEKKSSYKKQNNTKGCSRLLRKPRVLKRSLAAQVRFRYSCISIIPYDSNVELG